MTYEEKLDKIVLRLRDERELTRKGHKTKVTFDDSSFTKVRIREICKILLQLRDDEKVITISEALQPIETVATEEIINPSDNDDYENVEQITVEVGEEFDGWYGHYLVMKKSALEEITYLNLLRILNTLLDVRQAVQINKESKVIIPILPQRINFRELMLMDDIGQRDEFIQGRWDSLGYLKKEGIIDDFRLIDNMMHRWDNDIEIIINPQRFYPYYEKVKNEVSKRLDNKEGKEDEKKDLSELTAKREAHEKIIWPKDFRWENKVYVFGNYGKISFTSKDREHIFKTLVDKKGNWATLNELKGNKNADYVRSTIKQIEDKLSDDAKKHIVIVSTQEDKLEPTPSQGAYRIKVSL